MKRLVLMLFGMLSVYGVTVAQNTLPSFPPTERAVAFTLIGDTLNAAEVTLGNATYTIDFNPIDPSRWARTDGIGLIRYAPPGVQEGVYTFSPFFDGYAAGSAAENKNFVQEVVWAPNGQEIAFVVNNPTLEDVTHGVWYWQPARETPTDPAYQLLRQCPSACSMTNNVDNLQWRANFIEWAPDGARVLVNIDLMQEGRRALAVRPAVRDTAVSNTAPQPLRYDTGHWTSSGTVAVSGTNPQGQVGFGLVSVDGAVISFTPVALPVAAWVQDAVQSADGRFYMFGSQAGRGSALQLLDDAGRALTPVIGSSAPTRIRWNAARTAAIVQTVSETFVVQVNGTVTDVTSLVAGRVFNWASALPSNGSVLTVPPPLVTGAILSPQFGDILTVTGAAQIIYAEPADDAAVAGTLAMGQELMIISEPVAIGAVTWYRVQSVGYTGWINSTQNLAPAVLEG